MSPGGVIGGKSNGTVVAAGASLERSNRPVPRPRTAAETTVVRRAASPPPARPLRRSLDCRTRARPPALRAWAVPRGLFPAERDFPRGRATHGTHHAARRSRADVLVCRPRRRAQRAAGRVAACPAAPVRTATRSTDGVRLAGHGGLL